MPVRKSHCSISNKRTGETYSELHSWIDEGKDDNNLGLKGKNHHYSEELRDYVSKNFGGDEAVSEWLFHIAIDALESSIANDKSGGLSESNFFTLGFFKDGSVNCTDEALEDEELEEMFWEGAEEEEEGDVEDEVDNGKIINADNYED